MLSEVKRPLRLSAGRFCEVSHQCVAPPPSTPASVEAGYLSKFLPVQFQTPRHTQFARARKSEGCPSWIQCSNWFFTLRGEESLSTVGRSRICPFCTRQRTPLVFRRGAGPSATRNTATFKSQVVFIERSRAFGCDPGKTSRNRCSAPRAGVRTTRAAPYGRALKQWRTLGARPRRLSSREPDGVSRRARRSSPAGRGVHYGTRSADHLATSSPGRNNHTSKEECCTAKFCGDSKTPVSYPSKPPGDSVRRSGVPGTSVAPSAEHWRRKSNFEINDGSGEASAAGRVREYDNLLPEGTSSSSGTVRQGISSSSITW